jgi:mRNA interferase YafQ
MYKVVRSKKYKRDLRRLVRSGRFNMSKLEEILGELKSNRPLPYVCQNHKLHGIGGNVWECHIEPDLLLVYKKLEGILVLYLLRVGSHNDLFG